MLTVEGRDPYDVARALGVQQARNHPTGLFSALAAAAGRLAAAHGPARPGPLVRDPHVAHDLDAARFRFLAHGRRIHRGLERPVRELVDGFAAGVEVVRRELRSARAADGWAESPLDRLLAARVTGALVTALDFRIAAHHELVRLRHPPAHPSASNAVAVGGRRVRGGGGLLLIDPHIPLLAVPELRMIVVRIRTRGYHAAGMARLGSPLVFLGFSPRLAWTVTTNWPDTIRYRVLRRRGDSFTDLTSGRRLRRVEREVAVAVRGGRPCRRTLVFAGQLNAPVVRTLPGGRVLAAELAAAGAGDLSTQLYTAARVRTARAFQRRVLSIPGAALTNFVVADRDGGVGCFWHGRVPRDGGGYLDPVREMPADFGGDAGLLVQNNVHFDRVRPGAAALAAFAPRVADGATSLSTFRQERMWRVLGRKTRIGRADLEALALDAHDLRGGLFVARMTAEIRASRSVARWAPARRRRLARALAETARWGRKLAAGSRRASLIKLWMELAFAAAPDLGHAFNRRETVPDRLPAVRVTAAARALLDAADRWRRAGRPRWGEVHRLHLGGREFAVSGSSHVNRAAGWLVEPDLDPGTMHFPVEAGSACVIAVHLAPDRVRARFLKVLGAVEDPRSPLFARNAIDWADGRFRPLDLEPRKRST